ncbi:uncharacterized protein LOC141595418 [Silene latifolia]|uniref:uncharacterized protein LOC141595418 n=1 Tax=Silene latifolia TaxID=37657 RepID=UPI003D781D31
MHNGLNVKDKLCRIGYSADDRCIICDSHSETQDHLFFKCSYNQQILKLMELRCGFPILVNRNMGTGMPAKVWTQRNNARVNNVLLRPSKVTEQIIAEVQRRIRGKIKHPVKSNDQVWLTKWGVL